MTGRGPSTRGRWATRLALLTLLLIGAVALATSFGAGAAGWSDLFQDGLGRSIVWNLRLPRVVLAALLGGSLSVAGVSFQALLRNPLADPYVIGVSGGASLGGVVALLLGWGSMAGFPGAFALPLFAFAGALGALILIQWIATVSGRMTVLTVLLTGAIFNAFAAAAIYFIQSVASEREVHEIVFFLMGRIPAYDWSITLGLAAVFGIVVLILASQGRAFNALSLGEEAAFHLGVSPESLKRTTFVLGAILTGLAVAVAGMIGFVGLVVPHLLRLIFGPDHRLLLPASALGGATFLVLADWASRTLLAPDELPVGVLTALVGGPFFLILLRQRGRSHGEF